MIVVISTPLCGFFGSKLCLRIGSRFATLMELTLVEVFWSVAFHRIRVWDPCYSYYTVTLLRTACKTCQICMPMMHV